MSQQNMVKNNSNTSSSKRKWIRYTSPEIEIKFFVPFFGKAERFYPTLYYCEDQVKVVAFINNKQESFRDNSACAGKRQDFDFLPVLIKWRIKYLQSLYNCTEQQVNELLQLDEDIITLHQQIKSLYLSSEYKDLLSFQKYIHSVILGVIKNYDIDAKVEVYTYVNINKLHIKAEIKTNLIGSYNKIIDVIL